MKLTIGGEKRAGWVRLDARDGDITATIPPMPPAVMETKWDVIEWIHGPASLYPWQLCELLPQLPEALAPGGVLIMETPDAIKVATAMARNTNVVRWVFGDPSYKDPLYMNHWAYTPETMTEVLRAAGFSQIKVLPAEHHHAGRDFRIEASI